MTSYTTHVARRLMTAAGAALLAAGAACSDSTGVPDLNNVTTTTIAGGLNRVSAGSLLNGVLNGDRRNHGFNHIVFSETMARDVYNLDPAEPRFITELLSVPPDAGGFIGAGDWNGWYNNIRSANTLLDKIDAADGLTTEEKSAVKGVARTIKAIDFYSLLEMRDSLGAPIDVDRPAGQTPGEFRCKANVLAYVAALLDSAYTDLQAAGTDFPYALPPGFAGHGNFSDVAGFQQFNRGWKGKVEVYRGLDHQNPDATAFDRAITALNASFLSLAPSDVGTGVYYTYSEDVGEFSNPIFAKTIRLNPAVGDSVLPGDLRAAKITVTPAASRSGVTTTYAPTYSLTTILANDTRDLAFLKNEELVLLRAQAEIAKGDLAAALTDVNYVHVNAGGLTPYPAFATAKQAIDAVLYEKRYSLLLEGPQRLVDLRAYNRLNATNLKKELATDPFTAALPIPKPELDARGVSSVTPVCQ